jgi:N-acyl-phosphatidylethanolamine-hydrolysing phospholipase D
VRSLPARLVLVTSLLALLLVGGCAGVGGPKPGGPAHHRERGFANTSPGDPRPGLWTRARFFTSRMAAATFAPRTASFPRVLNDGRALREPASGPRVTWVGHATLLIQLDGVNVLTDPQWSERASPLPFAGPRRLTPPAVAFENLPPVHAVVISHDHYDHLDVATVRRLAATHRPRFFVPLGMKAWFADLGITEVDELDWWEGRGVRDVTLTLVPAHHWSQRTPWDLNRRLWGGWVVAGREHRLYFAGDTAYFDGFKDIGARLGPIDVAALPIGAYLPPVIMKPGHIDPAQALDAFVDLRARVLLAMHFGTFDLAEEPLEEPPLLLTKLAEQRRLIERVWILKHGETRAW